MVGPGLRQMNQVQMKMSQAKMMLKTKMMMKIVTARLTPTLTLSQVTPSQIKMKMVGIEVSQGRVSRRTPDVKRDLEGVRVEMEVVEVG